MFPINGNQVIELCQYHLKIRLKFKRILILILRVIIIININVSTILAYINGFICIMDIQKIQIVLHSLQIFKVKTLVI